MKLLDKIEKFDTEAKKAEENYKAMGADREEHQKKMLEFIHKKLEEEFSSVDIELQYGGQPIYYYVISVE